MDEYVIAIFFAALAGTTLSLGAWFVRVLKRDFVVTMWGVHARATNPAAYWFWAIYHVAGLAIVWTVAIGVAAEALLSLL
jgi:hypothetical protein